MTSEPTTLPSSVKAALNRLLKAETLGHLPDGTAATLLDAIETEREWRLSQRAALTVYAQVVEVARFLSTYEKDPPEITKDDFAYDRLLDFVHRVLAEVLTALDAAPEATP